MYRNVLSFSSATAVSILFLSLIACPSFAQWITQTIPLNNGWNAIYVEVKPYPSRCDLLFADTPIQSVWMYDSRFSSVQFIENPGDIDTSDPKWRRYFPPDHPEAFATNLFALEAGKAYLVKSATFDLEILGRPILVKQQWNANSLNLVGFNVDPAVPPTFATWFSPSEAHGGNSPEVWTLDPAGVWRKITTVGSTAIQPGRSYWVRCHDKTDYQGPVRIDIKGGRELIYGSQLVEHWIEVEHEGTGEREVTMTLLVSERAPDPLPQLPPEEISPVAGPVSLAYRAWVGEATARTVDYLSLPTTLSFSATDTLEKEIRVAVDRTSLLASSADDVFQSVLEFRDGAGFRQLIGVNSMGRISGAAKALNKMGLRQIPVPAAGLWVGHVTLNQVSEPQRAPDVLTDTASEFDFRVLLHVDADGVVRMLNEVSQMWRDGTYVPDPEEPGQFIPDEPGRFILMTASAPDALVNDPSVRPDTLRDGQPFSNRVSSAAFILRDEEGEPEEPVMTLTGDFGEDGSVLELDLVIDNSDPLNPFHHQYHPQHKYPAEGTELLPQNDWSVGWSLTFTFTDDPPGEAPRPAGWGDTQVGGTFEEEFTGLKNLPVRAGGYFFLNRVSTVPVLNDGL